MEIKKSKTVDLESRKLSGFLLGLIVALTLCFGALEYNVRPDAETDTDDNLDLFDEDMEKIPVLDQKDMIAAMEEPVSAPSATEKVEEVPLPSQSRDVDNVNLDEINDGKAAATVDVMPEKVEHQVVALPPVPVDENDNPLNWRVVEELPEFPGGMVEFMKWLTKNLKYPPMARSRNIQGKVVVQFVINKDGTICDAKVLKSVDASLDREALRVVGLMPKWSPGKQNGAPCRTLFVIPIIFKI